MCPYLILCPCLVTTHRKRPLPMPDATTVRSAFGPNKRSQILFFSREPRSPPSWTEDNGIRGSRLSSPRRRAVVRGEAPADSETKEPAVFPQKTRRQFGSKHITDAARDHFLNESFIGRVVRRVATRPASLDRFTLLVALLVLEKILLCSYSFLNLGLENNLDI